LSYPWLRIALARSDVFDLACHSCEPDETNQRDTCEHCCKRRAANFMDVTARQRWWRGYNCSQGSNRCGGTENQSSGKTAERKGRYRWPQIIYCDYQWRRRWSVCVYRRLHARCGEFARSQERRRITLINHRKLVELWKQFYPKLGDVARQRLPLTPIYFLIPET
jgi:hypothetical protein